MHQLARAPRIAAATAALVLALGAVALPVRAAGSDDAPRAPAARVKSLIAATPHLHKTPDDYCGSMIGCLGWYEFDNAKSVAGLISTETGTTGTLKNGQGIIVVPLESGGNDKGAQFALLYTTIAGSTKFVGYIPAPWGQLDVYVDKAGLLESDWEDVAAWNSFPNMSEAAKSSHRVVTVYDLTGIRLKPIRSERRAYYTANGYRVIK